MLVLLQYGCAHMCGGVQAVPREIINSTRDQECSNIPELLVEPFHSDAMTRCVGFAVA